MNKIFVNVDGYEGIYDHKLVAEGEAFDSNCVVAEVDDKELKELDKLKAAHNKYIDRVCDIYDRVTEIRKQREEDAKCKYRIRPGKWCGDQTEFGTERCSAHKGLKNKSNKMEAIEEEEE